MRTLQIEPLESRRPLAITATLNSGLLQILAADSADNDIAIVGTGVAGEVTITGRNGTTVNGLSAVTVSGVTGGLSVSLAPGAANNIIALDNVYVAGFININVWGS